MPVEDHQRAFALERPYELCYTHVRRDTHQQMNVIWARLSLDDLHFHLLTQLFNDFDNVSAHRLIDYFPAVLRRKYQVIFTSVA